MTNLPFQNNPVLRVKPIFKRLSLFFIVASIVIFSLNGQSQFSTVGPDAKYVLLKGRSYVESKNYYLLSLLESLPEVKKLITSDSTLVQFARKRNEVLKDALLNCKRDAICYTEKMKFSEEDIRIIGESLTRLYQSNNALGNLVAKHLILSGTYVLFQKLSPKEMLQKAWEQDAKGVNFTIGVYAEGKKANYPNIDSVSYDTRDGRQSGLLYNLTSLISIQEKESKVFFNVPLQASLMLLEINEREQVADYEPMASTVSANKAAFDRVKSVQWNKFKYTVILVPGAGPDILSVALSAEGMLRCRLAAIQYNNGLAPFIVVSGGKVHPYKTKYCEATEMKKFMMEKLHIPENAIIIDPHARHTTTNMRNTARIIFRYGMPFNKPGISCTTRGQSTMISMTLIDRCIKELNEAPYKNGIRLSETEVEFYPLIEALHINPTEPIDP
jgi:hypothetical protein